jgi:hypothetical protein
MGCAGTRARRIGGVRDDAGGGQARDGYAMNRRTFLGALVASLGTLAIDPATLLWRPPAVSEGLPVLQPDALVGLPRITREMSWEIGRLWCGGVPSAASKIGEDVLRHQFMVTMEAPGDITEYGLDPERYVRPAAAVLAERLRDARARVCGMPILPPAYDCVRVADQTTGVVVRGIVLEDALTLRFDVVCG